MRVRTPWWRRSFSRFDPLSLFEPDVMLPHQFLGQHAIERLGPEARLFQAIMDNALHALTYDPGHPRGRQIREEALAWIARPYCPDYDVSFALVIEAGYVGLDPEMLSRELVRRFATTSLNRNDYLVSRTMRFRQGPQGQRVSVT